MNVSTLVIKEAPGFGNLPLLSQYHFLNSSTLLHIQSLISLEIYIWYPWRFWKASRFKWEWSSSKVLRFQSTLTVSKAWFVRKLLSFHSYRKWMTPSVIHFKLKNYKPLILAFNQIKQIFNYLQLFSLWSESSSAGLTFQVHLLECCTLDSKKLGILGNNLL